MINRFSVGLIAASDFAFLAPLAATVKGYQPSTAIEGQILIAGAGNHSACAAKVRFGNLHQNTGQILNVTILTMAVQREVKKLHR